MVIRTLKDVSRKDFRVALDRKQHVRVKGEPNLLLKTLQSLPQQSTENKYLHLKSWEKVKDKENVRRSSPYKGWLYHCSTDAKQFKRHLWKIDSESITMFSSEKESHVFKRILFSSIVAVEKMNDVPGIKIFLPEETLTVTTSQNNKKSDPAMMNAWYNTIQNLFHEARKSSNARTDKDDEVKEIRKVIFHGVQFVLDLDRTSFKEKKQLCETITSNGGQISYIITSNSDFLVMSDSTLKNKPDSYKYRKAVASDIPVVSESFVKDCVKQGKISKVEVANKKAEENFAKGKIEMLKKKTVKQKEVKFDLMSAVKYKIDGGDCPEFPQDFQVSKFSILEEKLEKGIKVVAVEAHVAEEVNNIDLKISYRVMTSWKSSGEKVSRLVYPCANAAELSECYKLLVKSYLNEGLSRVGGVSDTHFSDVPSETLSLILSEMKASAGEIHPEVVRLLETIWMDSLGKLIFEHDLNPEKLTVDKIRNGLIVLLKIEEAIKQEKFDDNLSQEFYKYINEREKLPIDTIRKVAMKRELCQLIKDIVALNENNWMSMHSSTIMHQYSTLKCGVVWLDPGSNEFKSVHDLLVENEGIRYKIRNIFKVNRNAESCEFRSDLPNRKLLFHASSSANFVSIFSKGLVMPYTATSELGVERRDEGCFGSGIYFSNSFEKSSEFATMSPNRGTRLMLVNGVALGEIFETTDMRPDLLAPPDGSNSVKGIGNDSRADEYVVFSTTQQKMKYVIEFTLNDEQAIDYVSESLTLQVPQLFPEDSQSRSEVTENLDPPVKEVEYGLVVEGKKDCAKLEEFHIRGKVIDLVSEVTLFQSYKSSATKPVEAKYVFPLTDNAAVCGFEAFINEKHVIGEVKEKEEAHREYKKAVAEGHGAYLMDEESPNVFTVSIGNIPPGARVVIKVTYIVELETVDDPESCVLFTLPDSVSSWSKDSALLDSSSTQTTTKSVTVNSESKKSSFMLSIDMPFDILDISSQTHKIVSKKTATKACVKLQKTETLSGKSFQLLIKVAEIHVPRIWIEEDNDTVNGDQVAMVTFFPEFDFEASEDFDSTILLDMSNSMAGPSSGYAKYVSSLLIDKLPGNCRLNVIAFGSTFVEKFVSYEKATSDVKNDARKFVMSCKPQMGNSDLVNFFNSILLMTDVSINHRMQNIFLVSDGHLSDEDRILRIANLICKKSSSQTRVFTMAVGKSPNSHLLQSLSVATGGRYEHFLSSTRRTWKCQVENQVTFSKQPALTDVRIEWSNYESSVQEQKNILHAPEKVKCIFNGSRLTAYSFLPGCTKATLHARICGNEFSTVVMATSLSKISGKTLHRLAAKAVFKEYESGRLSDDGYVDQVIRDKRKSSIISLSIKFSVVSKFTSFVAIEKRKENEDMSITSGPRVEELVQSAFVDIIPEISWGFEGKSVEENIDDLLKRSTQMENSSIVRARELAIEAKSLFDTLSEPDACQKLLVCASLCKLDVTPEDFDASLELSSVLLAGDSVNYDVINAISRCGDHKIYAALNELTDFFWPEYCSIQLLSFAENFRPLVVGEYLRCCKIYGSKADWGSFSDDKKSMYRFWEEMRGINVGKEDEISNAVMVRARVILSQIIASVEKRRLEAEKLRLWELKHKRLIKYDMLNKEKRKPPLLKRRSAVPKRYVDSDDSYMAFDCVSETADLKHQGELMERVPDDTYQTYRQRGHNQGNFDVDNLLPAAPPPRPRRMVSQNVKRAFRWHKAPFEKHSVTASSQSVKSFGQSTEIVDFVESSLCSAEPQSADIGAQPPPPPLMPQTASDSIPSEPIYPPLLPRHGYEAPLMKARGRDRSMSNTQRQDIADETLAIMKTNLLGMVERGEKADTVSLGCDSTTFSKSFLKKKARAAPVKYDLPRLFTGSGMGAPLPDSRQLGSIRGIAEITSSTHSSTEDSFKYSEVLSTHSNAVHEEVNSVSAHRKERQRGVDILESLGLSVASPPPSVPPPLPCAPPLALSRRPPTPSNFRPPPGAPPPPSPYPPTLQSSSLPLPGAPPPPLSGPPPPPPLSGPPPPPRLSSFLHPTPLIQTESNSISGDTVVLKAEESLVNSRVAATRAHSPEMRRREVPMCDELLLQQTGADDLDIYEDTEEVEIDDDFATDDEHDFSEPLSPTYLRPISTFTREAKQLASYSSSSSDTTSGDNSESQTSESDDTWSSGSSSSSSVIDYASISSELYQDIHEIIKELYSFLQEKFKSKSYDRREIFPDFRKEVSSSAVSFIEKFMEIITEAGGKSLGVACFNAALWMLITAFVLEMENSVNAFLKQWLKDMDRIHPALYIRLELGSSWASAVKTVAQKLANMELKFDIWV